MKTLRLLTCTFLITLTACSDFSAIFRGSQAHSRKSSKKIKEKIVTQKTRKPPKPAIPGYLIWPVDGEVSSPFGERNGRAHDGIDIRAPKGTSIIAAADGEVVYTGKIGGYGNLILVRHDRGLFTVYAHNDENLVGEGKKVKQGDKIAKVGDTGNATGYHLHFEVREEATPVDPFPWLNSKSFPVQITAPQETEVSISEQPAESLPAPLFLE